MIEITSSSNAIFKKFLSLTKSKGLKEEGLLILSGKDLVTEFLKKPNLEIEAEIISADFPRMTKDTKVKSFYLSSALFKELDVLGTHSSLLVLKQPQIKAWDPVTQLRGLTLLAPLGDPTNLGALMRSAEAFGAGQIILLKESAHPFLPKSIKSSAGSALRIPLFKGPSIYQLDDMKIKNLLALDLNGAKLSEHQWNPDTCLLVGEEGAGLPVLRNAQKMTIPTIGVESLNATVAASIAMYSYSQA
jgi:TrmH family RNA methyltransferase